MIDNSINKSLENGIKIYGSVKKIPVDNDDGAYDFGGGVANAAKEKESNQHDDIVDFKKYKMISCLSENYIMSN